MMRAGMLQKISRTSDLEQILVAISLKIFPVRMNPDLYV
jgi:hypothetical protein